MRQSTPANIESEELNSCTHHWVIDRPAGPASAGVCKICGEHKEFRNYIEGSSWGNDNTSSSLSTGSKFPIGSKASGRRSAISTIEKEE